MRKWAKILALSGIFGILGLGLTACLSFSPLRAMLRPSPSRGPAPLRVAFDLSGSTGDIAGYLLEFGDGASVRGENVAAPVFHTYHDPGTYVATLTVWNLNGRKRSSSAEIRVEYPPLTATLEADVGRGVAPLAVRFLVRGEGGIASYELDFGDGNTHTAPAAPEPGGLADPVEHVYRRPGLYLATLTVYDRWGRMATDSLEIEVLPSVLRAVLNASPQTGTAPLEVSFDVSETVGEVERFVLEFGDGEVFEGGAAELGSPIVHTYGLPGIYTATLTVLGVYGGQDSQSLIIYVEYPPLAASLTAQPTEGAAPLEVTFDTSGTVGPIIYFVLDFGDGAMVSGNQLLYTIHHTYSAPGTYIAILQVMDAYGRGAQDAVRIEVR